MQQQKRNVTRMISLILAEKIFSLFLIMFMGYAVVHWGLLHAEDSKTLSLISLYLISPCVIISAFQVQYTPDVPTCSSTAAASASSSAASRTRVLFINRSLRSYSDSSSPARGRYAEFSIAYFCPGSEREMRENLSCIFCAKNILTSRQKNATL